GRTIPSSQVKAKTIANWIRKCEDWHGGDCDRMITSTSSGNLQTLRLIDTWRLCIVECSIYYLYLTLSYVWGNASPFELKSVNVDELGTPGALKTLWEQIPRTIQDAIRFTSKLRKRWLWVDSMCIIQDSDDDKSLYIPHMHVVYDRALLTIVAATGDSADAGLPGIRRGSGVRGQSIKEIIPGFRLVYLPDLRRAFSDCWYETRAWT
ncbi:HET-domain-containing protein, partial [Mytilinidion resinicola]